MKYGDVLVSSQQGVNSIDVLTFVDDWFVTI